MVKILKMVPGDSTEISLDSFERQQKINKVYVKEDGNYTLKEQPGIMDWSLEKKKEVAVDLADSTYISYLAVADNQIIGFVSLVKELRESRMILDVIQVDRRYRGQGIGRALWDVVYKEAKFYGAEAIYISACPAEETIGFYKAMGAEITDTPILSIAEEEPDDIQLVCKVK